jgi:hypothetical protein
MFHTLYRSTTVGMRICIASTITCMILRTLLVVVPGRSGKIKFLLLSSKSRRSSFYMQSLPGSGALPDLPGIHKIYVCHIVRVPGTEYGLSTCPL